jgi:hypothetical protein
MVWGVLVAAALGAAPAAGEIDRAVAAVRGAGPNGAGSAAAARAWQTLAAADAAALPALLAGMDGASPVARNWLRAAIDPVLERATRDQTPLPAAALEAFLREGRHDPQARRLAYELIVKGDPAAADRLLPGLLDDPSPDLRRDAVARLLDGADKHFDAGQRDEAKPLYQKALAAARDRDQLDRTAKRLGELGQKVDLADHLGFLRRWRVIGPFPNPGGQGIDTAYPPEQGLDFAAESDGKAGKVRWKEFTSTKETGVVDLNEAVGDHRESVAYAAAELRGPAARDAEVRLGCFTAFKLWVNGELALVRGDAYTGMRPDHYVAKVRLKPGTNTLLLKVAQDVPPPQLPPPNHWRFMLRVSDATGAAIK